MGKVQCILVLFLVWCAAFSCTYPLSSESFVRVSDRDDAGRYVFSLDMSDSAAVYTINFFTRLDCDDNMFASIGDIAIDVLVESPGHRKYSERVYLPASDIQKRSTGHWSAHSSRETAADWTAIQEKYSGTAERHIFWHCPECILESYICFSHVCLQYLATHLP